MSSRHNSIIGALNWASSYLKEHGREEMAAPLLLQHVLRTDRTGLLASLREEIGPDDGETFRQLVRRHAAGVPVQHLTGTEMFYGREFAVGPDVLIPRPETEELIEEILRRIPEIFGDRPLAVADIGTGSGIIGITMKCELPEADVTATDISEAALAAAERNADRLGAAIDFRRGHLTEPLEGRKWDVILSNPPYIGREEAPSLPDTVRDHEPHEALFADGGGLALYEELASALPVLLNKPGMAGVEIGYLQGGAVSGYFKAALPEAEVYVKQDINGKDRMVFCIVR
ncbi:peptide chain release factor N(5)-glutamine methyltransferase [Indiicoccus explosivorum]|uniref:peptide chain release factor N(5)-glutamine methyltransferase n=1 Tax=Indiicoccus explosivorum TaxID=1917864 RepID=UPI000B43087C|nr:peptide chain release factor N(5)-glutamine methyltransferase [Indiicoccus explosivorum]